jgi:two-component system, LuxR family, response regulator FixJ
MIMVFTGEQNLNGCHPVVSESMLGSRRGNPADVRGPGATRQQKGNEMTTPAVETVFIVGQTHDGQVVQAAESWGLATKTFSSGFAALAANIEHRRGCLITELRLPDMSGFELLDELKQRASIVPVVVLTAHADVALAVKAMRHGAVTVLEFPCSEADLSAAIREAIEESRQQSDERLKALEMRDRLSSLSQQEAELVEMILNGMKNNVIARRVGVSLRTVENRRRQVYEKMGAECVADLVQRVLLAKQTW